ncbi:MAG: winged helix-turn-helix transcriptional regulator [Lachnospiraceae bacterium]|nr:winged helix-turn-helix transcriptional regulator [Lachnospiraceae bacterium]
MWGYDAAVTDNNVEAYISLLRKKLARLQSKVRIATYWGLGYRLEEKA